jgi:hypothetical protein
MTYLVLIKYYIQHTNQIIQYKKPLNELCSINLLFYLQMCAIVGTESQTDDE